MTDVSDGDVAVIVYREDETWDTEVLPTALTEDLNGLIHALRQQPSIGGTIGLVTVGDDFFVALRVIGGQVSVFLSDLTAAADWPLARQVLDYLDIPIPGEDDLDQVLPAGDMSIFADLGIDEMDLGALAGDLDQFPDEAIAKILSPAENKLFAQSLTLTTLSKSTRALSHPHYTFRKKLSHTADSQDQRHRMVPGSRPLLVLADTGSPDFVTPWPRTGPGRAKV